MTWDSVPWFVGGGAQHSPEVARLLAYAATSASEGIVTPGDLKVVPLDVPGAAVRALAGACLVLNRNSAGAQQTYVGRNPSADQKTIASTGSGGGRNDLVIAQIKDPFVPGSPVANPANVTVGPYIFTEIISNVPNAAIQTPASAAAHLRTLGISGIALAAIIIPVSTGTITSGMIRDLRVVANPRRSTFHTRVDMTYSPDDMGSAAYANFPNVVTTVDVPEWATTAVVRLDITGVQARNAALDGRFRALFGTVYTKETYYNEQVVGDSRNNYVVSSTVAIPAAMRGTNQQLRPQAMRANGVGILRNQSDTQVVFEVTFIESAV